MKTVVVANFPDPEDKGAFTGYFPDIAKLEDVIFIENPETIEITQILIDAGSDLDLRDNNGWTALMRAVENQNTEVIIMLFEGGAKNYLDAQNLALEIGQKDVIETLNQAIIKRQQSETLSITERLEAVSITQKLYSLHHPEQQDFHQPLLNLRGGKEIEPIIAQQELHNQDSHRDRPYSNPQLRGGNQIQPSSTIKPDTELLGIGAISLIALGVTRFIVRKLTRDNEKTENKVL